MLQSTSNNTPQNSTVPNTYTPVRTASVPVEQGSIGRSIVIKGEVSGAEPLYIDGSIEGKINFADHRVTVGRHGSVTANISAKEVVIMGTVKGNIQCTDRLDIRAEGSLTGDVVTRRISVEDGAVLKGSVQVQTVDHHESKHEKAHSQEQAKASTSETVALEKFKTATAGSSS
jgi:cytoskeletal protein CcmA (bactofilin family)